jgi:hypothetical protein
MSAIDDQAPGPVRPPSVSAGAQLAESDELFSGDRSGRSFGVEHQPTKDDQDLSVSDADAGDIVCIEQLAADLFLPLWYGWLLSRADPELGGASTSLCSRLSAWCKDRDPDVGDRL